MKEAIRIIWPGALLSAAAVVLCCLIVASTAFAYRPPLSSAYPASDHRAAIECWSVVFPLDPINQRCLTSGTSRQRVQRRPCMSERGRPNGAWCFLLAWATNRDRVTWFLRIKVSEICKRCLAFRSRTYSRTR